MAINIHNVLHTTIPPKSFDPYSESVQASPVDAFSQLAKGCAVYHYQGLFDYFIVNDPIYISEVMLRDSNTWTVEQGSAPTPFPQELKTPLMREDASHAAIRQVLQRGFAPRELLRLKEVVGTLVNDLIDQMLARPEQTGDFFTLFAMPLPARLMCIMLGTPEDQYQNYKNWADRYYYSIFNDPAFDLEQQMEHAHGITDSLFSVIAHRRDQLAQAGLQPNMNLVGSILPNDFLSRFMCSQIDGAYLDDAAILGLMLAVILGGNETTMNLIGNLLWRLLEVPERWEAVKSRPELIEAAIEESLRLDPPVLAMIRTAKHDVSLHGTAIPAGAKAMYNVPAVNRYSGLFESPDSFRFDRPRESTRKHASFASGVHLCPGAPLARMEVRTAFEILVRRIPNLRLNGIPQRADGFNIWGQCVLPVSWSG